VRRQCQWKQRLKQKQQSWYHGRNLHHNCDRHVRRNDSQCAGDSHRTVVRVGTKRSHRVEECDRRSLTFANPSIERIGEVPFYISFETGLLVTLSGSGPYRMDNRLKGHPRRQAQIGTLGIFLRVYSRITFINIYLGLDRNSPGYRLRIARNERQQGQMQE
jgi:hypothetical protein